MTRTRRARPHFDTHVPAFADTRELAALLKQHNVTVDAKAPDTGAPLWETLLLGLGPTILLFGLLFWLFRRAAQRTGGLGGMGGLGRAKVKRADPDEVRVTFDDVAGIDEVEGASSSRSSTSCASRSVPAPRRAHAAWRAAQRLARHREDAARAGDGRRGGRAVLHHVGVGVHRDDRRRRRFAGPRPVPTSQRGRAGDHLHRRARCHRPPARRHAFAGGSDEREQTLNQILTEMDGFDPRSGIVVLAATNRPDVLDPALLRPGRFDRRVHVSATGQGRASPDPRRPHPVVPLAADVDLDALAATTPGMVGRGPGQPGQRGSPDRRAETPRGGRACATSPTRSSASSSAPSARSLMTSDDRGRTAYHEAGHAVVGMLTPGADPVRKVSIIPRGQALGVTFSAPDVDRLATTRASAGPHPRGARRTRRRGDRLRHPHHRRRSDLQQITDIARRMVGRWGMSDAVGPMVALPADSETALLPGSAEASSDTQRLVDEEVRRILADAHRDVTALLTEHRENLDTLAHALLEHETLDGPAAYRAAGQPFGDARATAATSAPTPTPTEGRVVSPDG